MIPRRGMGGERKGRPPVIPRRGMRREERGAPYDPPEGDEI